MSVKTYISSNFFLFLHHNINAFKLSYISSPEHHNHSPCYHMFTYLNIHVQFQSSFFYFITIIIREFLSRMFHSVKEAWNSASRHNMADVKELIPEFFYLPEFLLNSNNFDLGEFR